MIDGVSSLATFVHGMRGDCTWADRPGTNVLDGGAPFYEVYETSDGGHVAVASVEPRFYSQLLSILEIPEHEIPQWDRAGWPASKRRLATIFGARTRKEWEERFAGSDACVTPVLRMPELGDHPHHAARASFTNYRGNAVPVVAPRLSRTPGRITDSRELEPGEVLRQWGAH
jgi:alpha-methylacyl-CoA racemase